MVSFARLAAALFLVCLAACSSEVITIGQGFAKPSGCKESFCDVHYDRCYDEARSGSGSRCGECSSICSGSSNPSCYPSCLSACQDSSSLPSVDHCGKALQACRSTAANRGCADGIERSSIPHAVPSAKAAFKPPAEPHQGVCSEEDLLAFVEKCESSSTLCFSVTPRCLACLVVDEGADRWGPYVRRADGSLDTNRAGCIASLGDPTCAANVFAASRCHEAACPSPDHTCSDLADAVSCAAETEAAKCSEKLWTDPAFTGCFGGPVFDATWKDPLPKFFCGK